MKPLILVFGPAVDEVTLTETEQLPFAGIVPPEKFKVVALAAGDQVGGPVQVVDALGVEATFIPVGSASEKAPPVSAMKLGLVSVKVSTDVPPDAMEAGTNALPIVGYFGTPQPVNVTPSI
jgi:hypothetical protein